VGAKRDKDDIETLQGFLPQRTVMRTRLASDATAPLAIYRLIASVGGGESALGFGGSPAVLPSEDNKQPSL